MKVISSLKFILLSVSFLGTTIISFAQSWPVQAWIPAYLHAKQVQQDNEFTKNITDDASEFYCNPVLLNGKVLDYNDFTLSSKGTLTVVMGNPANANAEKIPFKVMLRRDGKIITTIDLSGKGLYEVDVAKVFVMAKSGDQLIIDPVNAKDWRAKRILKLLGGDC